MFGFWYGGGMTTTKNELVLLAALLYALAFMPRSLAVALMRHG